MILKFNLKVLSDSEISVIFMDNLIGFNNHQENLTSIFDI